MQMIMAAGCRRLAGVRDRRKKGPGMTPGPASLIAVITLRHLLREEKQGTTASRLLSENEFSSKPRPLCSALHDAAVSL
jgi:hypothetical protein